MLTLLDYMPLNAFIYTEYYGKWLNACFWTDYKHGQKRVVVGLRGLYELTILGRFVFRELGLDSKRFSVHYEAYTSAGGMYEFMPDPTFDGPWKIPMYLEKDINPVYRKQFPDVLFRSQPTPCRDIRKKRALQLRRQEKEELAAGICSSTFCRSSLVWSLPVLVCPHVCISYLYALDEDVKRVGPSGETRSEKLQNPRPILRDRAAACKAAAMPGKARVDIQEIDTQR